VLHVDIAMKSRAAYHMFKMSTSVYYNWNCSSDICCFSCAIL